MVVIGGGTGLSVMLRGMKQIENINLTAIVTVADDGGSTGRIRRQFHIPAMGDVRNVMCAMAEEESIFTSLMNYRFDGECDDVGGHNLGNLILTAMTKTTGSFMKLSVHSQVSQRKGTDHPKLAAGHHPVCRNGGWNDCTWGKQYSKLQQPDRKGVLSAARGTDQRSPAGNS